ncbi:MAG: hypothetical protein ACRC5H_02465 [Treponemataceae bacterium]
MSQATDKRMLSDEFMKALLTGSLNDILKRVKEDDTLLLQIRKNYINIYYRGCSALKLDAPTTKSENYMATIDKAYLKEGSAPTFEFNPDTWLADLPTIKNNIDCNLGAKRRSEREFQQLVARENSFSEIANSTDYFIVDIERTDHIGRFDMVAIKWLATSHDRKNPTDCQLVFIEMKYGHKSFDNLEKHYEDINKFLFNNDLREEALSIFKQLRELGLVELSEKNKNEVVHLNDKVEFILLCANLSPNSTKNTDIQEIVNKFDQSKPKNLDYRFATASFMGYALYDKFMLNKDDFFTLLISNHTQK